MACSPARLSAHRETVVINASFAVTRPEGAYALAVTVGRDDMLHDRLAFLPEAQRSLVARAAEAQRFERDPGTVAETFVDDDGAARRILLVGIGAAGDENGGERAGSALAARLLVSGETRLVVDAEGLDATTAARLAFAASARSWRYDRYRTKLPAKQRPTLAEIVLVGADAAAEGAFERQSALLAGLDLTRALVSEPANIVYPESFVDRARAALEPLGVAFEVLDEAAMKELGDSIAYRPDMQGFGRFRHDHRVVPGRNPIEILDIIVGSGDHIAGDFDSGIAAVARRTVLKPALVASQPLLDALSHLVEAGIGIVGGGGGFQRDPG